MSSIIIFIGVLLSLCEISLDFCLKIFMQVISCKQFDVQARFVILSLFMTMSTAEAIGPLGEKPLCMRELQ